MINGQYNIKHVAVYLRKSRGENEKDLENHRNMLINICQKEHWKYDVFEEIVSGESLELRHEAQRLLKIIEVEEHYDAVLVVDIDRLSRAGTAEAAYIRKILIDSNTLLVVNNRIMDLENEQDDMNYEIQSFVAKLEYKMIKKRLRQGKFENASKGYWSNGSPPIPYVYNRDTKLLDIDKDLLKTYRYIIEAVVIYHKSTNEIAYTLNNKGWLTAGKNGKRYWTSKTVRDTLLDKTHLQYDEKSDCGCIVIGKSKGNGHKKKASTALKYKQIPEDKWFVFKGLHSALKTIDEENAIKSFLERKTKVPRRTAKKIYPLTGLIRCGCCGHYLGFTERKDRKGLLSVKKCWYKDPFGNKCPNRSGSMLLIIDKIHEAIQAHISDLECPVDIRDTQRIESVKEEIQQYALSLQEKETAIERIEVAYESGAYTVDELKARKNKIKSEMKRLREETKRSESELDFLESQGQTEKIDVLNEFQELIVNSKLTWEEQNELYKTLIDYIEYTRVGEEIIIQIAYK
ncbi:recombinase family protein [Faecalispora jeddahensis]|uniref:recombinase family protein n=1 Tax=Faecalispora jeddahensis TaxID=1414721 RepID=UPI00189894FD|nr:recombinase family protein [Faecalispora jeddahensis]